MLPSPATTPIVAIDFETANEQRASACAIGLAFIEGGRVVATEEYLIRPPELRFTPFTIGVHGIRPEDVAHKPEFPDLWERLRPRLGGALLLAHNASFDMSVLRATLAWYGLGVPAHSYLCTLLTARRLWPDLERHKLNYLAWHFGIELDHHKAGSDARACAEIALRAMAESGADDLAAMAALSGISLGSFGGAQDLTCKAYGAPRRGGSQPIRLPQVLRDPALAGRRICFTGTLSSLTRGEAEALAAVAGLIPQGSVTAETAYLVVGRTRDSTKLRTARNRGDQGPAILDEEQFRAMLGLAG